MPCFKHFALSHFIFSSKQSFSLMLRFDVVYWYTFTKFRQIFSQICPIHPKVYVCNTFRLLYKYVGCTSHNFLSIQLKCEAIACYVNRLFVGTFRIVGGSERSCFNIKHETARITDNTFYMFAKHFTFDGETICTGFT